MKTLLKILKIPFRVIAFLWKQISEHEPGFGKGLLAIGLVLMILDTLLMVGPGRPASPGLMALIALGFTLIAIDYWGQRILSALEAPEPEDLLECTGDDCQVCKALEDAGRAG